MIFINAKSNGNIGLIASGYTDIEAGEAIAIQFERGVASLRIEANGAFFKLYDTGRSEKLINDEEDLNTDGWNTVGGEDWRAVDANPCWEGVRTAVKIISKSDNTETIRVSWGVR